MEEARIIIDDLQNMVKSIERLPGNRASKDIEAKSGPLETEVKVRRGKRVKLPDIRLLPRRSSEPKIVGSNPAAVGDWLLTEGFLQFLVGDFPVVSYKMFSRG